jgi:hypothetical protein
MLYKALLYTVSNVLLKGTIFVWNIFFNFSVFTETTWNKVAVHTVQFEQNLNFVNAI